MDLSSGIRFERGDVVVPGVIAEVDIHFTTVSEAYEEAKRNNESVADILVRQRKAVEL